MPSIMQDYKKNMQHIFKIEKTPMLLRTLEPRIALDASAVLAADAIADNGEQHNSDNTQNNQEISVIEEQPIQIVQKIKQQNQQGLPQTVAVNVILNDDQQIIMTSDPIMFDPLENDQNIGTGTTVVIQTQPTNGTAVVNSDNTITYTPTSDPIQSDSFTYTITITPPPEPVAATDRFNVIKDTPYTFDVAINDQNVNGAEFMIINTPQFGTISKPQGEAPTSSRFIYTPNEEFTGIDHVDYMVRVNGVEVTATIFFRVEDDALYTHYIPPRPAGIGDIDLRIFTLSEKDINFTITYLSTGETETGTVSLFSPYQSQDSFSLGKGISAIFKQVQRDGILIEADGPINVHAYNSVAGKDSFVSEGMKDAGTMFFLGSVPGVNALLSGGSNSVSIIATEDNTQITINRPVQKSGFEWQDLSQGQNSNVLTITLNKGESYMLRTAQESTQSAQLTFYSLLGVEVRSDKPIKVSAGSIQYRIFLIGGGTAEDDAWDMISPITRVDTNYIFRWGVSAEERMGIVVTEDNTQISTVGIDRGTFERGHVYIEQARVNNPSFRDVTATKPIYVYRLSGDNDTVINAINLRSENGFALLPPIGSSKVSGTNYLDIPSTDTGTTLVGIYIEDSKQNTVKVFRIDPSNSTLVNINLNSFTLQTNILGGGGYVIYEGNLVPGQYVIYAEGDFWINTRHTTNNNGSLVNQAIEHIENDKNGLVAINDDVKTIENQAVTIDPTDNDANFYDQSLQIVTVSNPINGSAQINGQNIIYTPNANFFGTDSFTYVVSNKMGHTQTATVNVQVDERPSATVTIESQTPPIAPTISDVIISEGIQITPVNLAFTPTENDPITYTANGLPDGLSIDPNTGIITGIPTGELGTYTATVTAEDKDGKTELDFTINVARSQISEGKEIIPIDVGITPVDQQTAIYSATGLPNGLAIDQNTGFISGTPAIGTVGEYPITVTVTDADGTRNAEFTIIISQEQTTPIREGTQIDPINVGFNPNDTNPITYAASGLPNGLGINGPTGLITGIVAQGSAGTYPVTVIATDQDSTSIISFIITIESQSSDIYIDDFLTQKNQNEITQNDRKEIVEEINANENNQKSMLKNNLTIINTINQIDPIEEKVEFDQRDNQSTLLDVVNEIHDLENISEKTEENQNTLLLTSFQTQIWNEIANQNEKIQKFARALQ